MKDFVDFFYNFFKTVIHKYKKKELQLYLLNINEDIIIDENKHLRHSFKKIIFNYCKGIVIDFDISYVYTKFFRICIRKIAKNIYNDVKMRKEPYVSDDYINNTLNNTFWKIFQLSSVKFEKCVEYNHSYATSTESDSENEIKKELIFLPEQPIVIKKKNKTFEEKEIYF